MGVRDKSPDIRYFTYFVCFPDGDMWIRQTAFVHSLQFELKNLLAQNKLDPAWKHRCNDLVKKGETFWKDTNGVEHRVVIESKLRSEKWGVR